MTNKLFIVKYILFDVDVDIDVDIDANIDASLDKQKSFDDANLDAIAIQNICFFDVANNVANNVKQSISTFDVAIKLVKIVDEIKKI